MITRAVRDDKHGSRTPRRRTLLLLGMLVVLLWVHVQLGAQVDLVDHHLGGDTVRAAEANSLSQARLLQAGGGAGVGANGGGGSLGRRETGWEAALAMLRASSTKYVLVDAKNGLGNRLRALASAMSVAAALGRPVLLIWVSDLHCNCSYRRLFAQPLPFALLDEEIPRANLTDDEFQVYNYMRPEPGAVKDAFVEADLNRHLYFKSAFIMNHPAGGWKFAQRQIQRLTPVDRIAEMLQANKNMVGLHVRNVFDAPRDAKTNTSVTGAEAVAGARKEYGAEGTRQLMMWRKASHWTNFVPRMIALLRENSFRNPLGLAQEPLQFYLAADSEDAYTGLTKRFPNRIKFQQRDCASERCDFRDCEGMIYSIVDMLNLGRTKLILGSGWSSYSEVASYMGGDQGMPVPILMAGRDFGAMVDDAKKPSRNLPQPACCNPLVDQAATTGLDFSENMGVEPVRWAHASARGLGREGVLLTAADTEARDDSVTIQRLWPKPFEI